MTFKSFLEEKEKKNKNCKYLELDEHIRDQNFNENDFEKLFFNFNKPTIIRGFCKNTIAFNTWNENREKINLIQNVLASSTAKKH